MNIPGVIAIGILYVIILLFAVWSSHRKKKNDDVIEHTATDFILAGRNFGFILATFSMSGIICMRLAGVVEIFMEPALFLTVLQIFSQIVTRDGVHF